MHICHREVKRKHVGDSLGSGFPRKWVGLSRDIVCRFFFLMHWDTHTQAITDTVRTFPQVDLGRAFALTTRVSPAPQWPSDKTRA